MLSTPRSLENVKKGSGFSGRSHVRHRVLGAVATVLLAAWAGGCASKPKPAPTAAPAAQPGVDPCRQAQHLKIGMTAAAAKRILVASPMTRTMTCLRQFGEEAPDCMLLDYRSETCNLVVYLSARDHRVVGWGPLTD
jgi:hypothetical protein